MGKIITIMFAGRGFGSIYGSGKEFANSDVIGAVVSASFALVEIYVTFWAYEHIWSM